MEIKALETRYAGHRFRSRLEARHAVLFDHLGIRWDYEPEGFTTPAGPYLPDFLLHLPQGPVLFEVKPTRPVEIDDRWYYASNGAHAPIIVAYGLPRPDQLDPYDPYDGHYLFLDGRHCDLSLHPTHPPCPGCGCVGDISYAFCTCPWCHQVGIEYAGRGARVCGYKAHGLTLDQAESEIGHYDKAYSWDDPHIVNAYKAALSARFEHGASG